MGDAVQEAMEYFARVPFPEMALGADGKIVAADGRLICTMNLRDLTLTEAFAFAKAFVAAGEALATIRRRAPLDEHGPVDPRRRG